MKCVKSSKIKTGRRGSISHVSDITYIPGGLGRGGAQPQISFSTGQAEFSLKRLDYWDYV